MILSGILTLFFKNSPIIHLSEFALEFHIVKRKISNPIALNFFILAIHLFFITNWWNSKGTIIYLYLGIKHFVCITISLE